MKRQAMLVIVATVIGSAAFGEYDYFRNAQYPVGLRPDVGLDKVEQEGGPDATGYKKRTVQWWPKRGVDVVDVPKGAVYRTWTLDTEKDGLLGEFRFRRKWGTKQPKQFKAHLLGFRGIANDIGSQLWGGPPRIAPAAVLRLEDGSKRCFTRDSFCKADEDFLMDLFLKEMKRIQGTLYKAYYNPRLHSVRSFPNNALPTEVGTMRLETPHFSFNGGSQAGPGRSNPWVDIDEPEETARFRKGSKQCAEFFWTYLEHAGSLMPFWDKETLHKYNIKVAGTYRDGEMIIPGFAGGGYGGCVIANAGGGPWSPGLFHEWGHGVPNGGILYPGGAETASDGHQMLADASNLHKALFQIYKPDKCIFYAFYPAAFGYLAIGDDPNWGYAVCNTALSRASDWEFTTMHTIARQGQERGLWKNGVKGFGDMIGQIYARWAEFDFEQQHDLRRQWNTQLRHYLETVDREKRIYRSPQSLSPEPYGGNFIKIVPDKGATELTVDFKGLYDPDTHGDWRACIVAVDENGKCRYSPLWNQGVMSMEIKPGDDRFWLTVAATPEAMPDFDVMRDEKLKHLRRDGPEAREGWNAVPKMIYEVSACYKYPYEVTLTGCRPGSRHLAIGENQNLDLIYGADNRKERRLTLPHAGDTPQYAKMKQRLEALIADLTEQQKALELQIPKSDWDARTIKRERVGPAEMKWTAQWLIDNGQGARHANGGGWVAASATVAPTAYVGPAAMVLDGAKVLGDARISDSAVVSGPNVVVDKGAHVYGDAAVMGNYHITDYARIWRSIFRPERLSTKPGPGGKMLVAYRETPKTAAKTITRKEKRELFTDDAYTLEANYAFDSAETVRLEDWFQARGYTDGRTKMGGPHYKKQLFHDGVLHGRPGFAKDGTRRVYTFNGKDQYAEAGAAVGDFGEITIDAMIKWDGGAGQVLFDFGSSKANRYVLSPAGKSGKPELLIVLGGKVQKVVATKAIEPGAWTDVRVEIDGEKVALYIGGMQSAVKETSFRPSDAYPGGGDPRNFIAALRDGRGCFKGAIDYVRIYHAVLGNFDDAPKPPVIAPRRLDPEIVKKVMAYYNVDSAGDAARNAALASAMADMTDDLGEDSDAIDALVTVTDGSAPHDHVESMAGALYVQQAEWWVSPKWESRLRWEISGEISPHLRRWLARIKPDKYKAPTMDPKLLKPDPKIAAELAKIDPPPEYWDRTPPPPPTKAAWGFSPVAITTTSIKMGAMWVHETYDFEYRFDEVSGEAGGTSSQWQKSPVYTDTGLTDGKTYRYKVRMRLAGGKEIAAGPEKTTTIDLNTYFGPYKIGVPVIVGEAKNGQHNHATATHQWKAESDTSEYVVALPGNWSRYEVDECLLKAPRMDHLVKFEKPGKYWVWVKGLDIGHKTFKTGNTVIMGIDLEPKQQLLFMTGLHGRGNTPLWAHSSIPLEIKKAGVRRISVWAREMGTIYGKLLISPKSPSQYKPSNQVKGGAMGPNQVCGEGPDQSPIIVAGKRELAEDASISEKLDEGDGDVIEDFFGLDD